VFSPCIPDFESGSTTTRNEKPVDQQPSAMRSDNKQRAKRVQLQYNNTQKRDPSISFSHHPLTPLSLSLSLSRMTLVLLPEPLSPRQRRTLKGESIRSLRGSFQKSLSNCSDSSLLPTSPASSSSREDDDVNKKGQSNIDSAVDQQRAEQRADDEAVISSSKDDDHGDDDSSSKKPQSPSSVLLTSRRPAHEVRLQFLQNLGIQKQPDPATDNNSTSAAATTTFEPWGPSYEGLVNDDGQNGNNNNNHKNSAHTCPLKENRTLQFDGKVRIHPIPSHKVYSNRVKQTIWTCADELNFNVARNSLEFSYEDWNADNVVDEESGLIWYSHGVGWVHPVHFLDLAGGPSVAPPTPTAAEQQQPPQPEEETALSSDEVWRRECERLGIQPAEHYHSLSSSSPDPTSSTNNDTCTTTTAT
jgi:hypothetical protein